MANRPLYAGAYDAPSGEQQSSWYVPRIVPKENADVVFLLRDLPLKIGHFSLRRVYQLFCLTHVQQGTESVLLSCLRQLQGILPALISSRRSLAAATLPISTALHLVRSPLLKRPKGR
jgi:hypothetical protein